MLLVDEAVFNFKLTVRERKTDVGIGARTVPYDHIFEYAKRYTNGAGADKVNAVWSRRVTIAAGVPIDVDLRSGLVSVVDGLTPVLFPVICGVFVRNLSEVPGQGILIGAGPTPFASWLSNGATARRCGPDGFEAVWNPIDGFQTTLDSADLIRFAAVDLAVAADILILGRSS